MPTNTSALIPAAGLGTRLGLGPKCLLRIGERTLLEIIVATIQPLVDEVLVAVPDDFVIEVTALLKDRATVIPGGNTRQASIDKLITASTGQVVLLQDGARPFASSALCAAVLEAAALYGAAGAFLDPTVPVGHIEGGMVASYQTRQEARIFQAPQAYRRAVLLSAQQQTAGRDFQSTAQMVITAGFALRAVAGEPENIKITTSLDWQIAQKVIAPALGLDA